ncbi:TPA: helix-turn-helix transcriptional regulator [Escherichia coli]|uniref:helix-turn-helix domain-containing protein n=1 Tax=Escherichia coli TaxID=562 RepID=UPI000DA4F361|nr:helix-turn-helix transcriptional regulator [Escherichia coli]SQP99652.1 repressor protein C (modular protein) from prophage [Escherichia coli]HBE5192569.1 helix-turn-helix transcriptional regulator [Escherichia coli]HBE5291536.1 helix-turn-helix transcriptional regulator [Escherichia coli]
MMNMSIDYSQKLRAIRKSENLTQAKFAEIIGISLGAVSNYESGFRPARIEIVEKVILVSQFEKYTMWLLHGKTFPQAGQIAPALSLDGSGGSEAAQDSTTTNSKSRQ